jgi:hypothetical protein
VTPYQAAWPSSATTRVNPQTVVLAGYSDNYSGLRDVDLAQTDRTSFIKLGYAWVL